jgi:dTMP kinase
MYASRRDHIERTLRPALERGAVVLCDRYADSTRAYQGAAGGADPGLISALETYILEEVRPARTLVFDLDPELGLARALGRPDAEARFESKGLDFHRRLREGFLAIARAEPERCRIIDAAGDPDAVETRILAALAGLEGLAG